MFSQNFTHPLNASLTTFSGRNITVAGDNMVPVAITTSRPVGTPYNERVAISWYDPAFSYGHATKVRVYSTMADFESNAAGTDISGLIGVEALAFDQQTPSNLYVMETENVGGNMKIYNSSLTLVASYSSGDIGTALGTGFNNARGMAFDLAGNVYIADDGYNRIIKIVGATNKATATISSFISLPAGSSPKSVAIKDTFLYVACFSSKKIRKYKLADASFVSEISTGSFSPLDLDIRKYQGNHLYSSQLHILNSAKVVAYDISNNAEVQTYNDFGTSAGPWGLNVNSRGNLYCSDGSNNRFVKYARTLENGKDILTFTVDNQVGTSVFNNAAKTITIKVPSTYDLSSVNTHYTISHFATSTPESYDYNLMPTNFSVTNPLPYTVTAENGSTQIWNVTLVKQQEGKDILTYTIPNQIGTSIIDPVNGTIAITMPAGTNTAALTPLFTLSPLAIASPASGISANYTTQLVHTVTAENGTTKAWTVTVTVQPTLSSEKEIISFTIPNQVGSSIINSGAATIAITMPSGTNASALIPTFTLSPLATASPVSGISANYTSPVVHNVTAQNGTTKAWTVTVTVLSTLSSEKEILTYSIPNQIGSSTINPANATVDITMPFGTDVTSLLPSFTISPGAMSNVATGIAQNFTSPVMQTVTAQDGSTKAWTINVSSQLASILFSLENKVQIYPNPLADKLNIYSHVKLEQIEILTLTGAKIFGLENPEKSHLEINSSEWNTGIYFIKIVDKSGNTTIQSLQK